MQQSDLTPAQQAIAECLKAHAKAELVDRDVDATLATMTDDPYIFLAPTLAGGEGREGVRAFYRNVMQHLPEDFDRVPITKTVGNDQIVVEEILSFTHTVQMDWLLPGIAPTGKRVELPLIVVCTFKGGKLESERAYWDQASMLTQVGLLDAVGLSSAGARCVPKLLELTNRP